MKFFNKSIKWKMVSIFLLIILFCIGSILFFNTLFLERFYINQKKGILKKTYEVLDKGITDLYKNGLELSDLFNQNNLVLPKKREMGPGYPPSDVFKDTSESSFATFLRELQETYNVDIVLVDEENKIYSLYQNNKRFDKRITYYLFNNIVEDPRIEILEETNNYKIAINNPLKNQPIHLIIPDGDRGSNIECFGFLSDNITAFYMTIPLTSITEPIRIFNHILIIISIFTIFIATLIVYYSSCRITKPIVEMATLSEKISNLEFESRYNGDYEDEIGILGNSMNEMSEKLKMTMKELKNANAELIRDIEKKEKLDEMRQEFVANVSHELKTPIALIQGYAEGLQCLDLNNEENKKYYTDVIIDESNKMNKIVMQLLNLSSLERGMSNIEIIRCNLCDIVKNLVNVQEINLKNHNFKIEIDIPSNTYIWADELKTEEVVRNYLTNAIHYVSENGLIKLYVENLSNDKIRFFVYNSGIILSEENRERVFDKFFKVDKARTRAYGGSGLGLSIVKAIAIQHNTICGVENVINNQNLKDGVKFYFDFSIK